MDRFYGSLTITGLLLGLLHWFPWTRRLPRLAAYAAGVGAINLGLFLWLGPCETFFRVFAFSAVAGGATALSWGVDRLGNWIGNLYAKAKEARDGGHERPR